MDVDLQEEHRLTTLLRLMTQGARLSFDRKTHRRGRTIYTRLKYTHLTAKLLEDRPPEELTEEILDHLIEARLVLQKAWGYIEWTKLAQNEIVLKQLHPVIQERLSEALGSEHYTALSTTPLADIGDEDRETIVSALGKRTQNEVYRHLLLTIISEQWVEYLTSVEALRVSIRMEAYAQRDPLVMYKSQATEMFSALLADIRMAVISRMFTYRPRSAVEADVERARQERAAAPVGQTESQQAKPKKKKRRKRHKKRR